MRLLSRLLLLTATVTVTVSFAQQTIATGINVRPNAARTAGGYIDLYTAANTVAARLQAQALTGIPRITSNTVDGILEFCDSSLAGAWVISRTRISGYDYHSGSACTGDNSFYVENDGGIATSLGLCMFEAAPISILDGRVCVRAPAGGVGTSYTVELPGTGPSVAGQALSWVSGSTYEWASPSGANTTLSNLVSPTAINQDLLPGASVTYSLGADTVSGRWKDGAVGDWDVGDDIFQGDGGFPLRKITITAPSGGFASSWTWQWPTGPGTSGYVLSTNGSGATSWIAAGGTGTVTSAVIQGTANEIDVSGTCTIITTGTCTIGIPTNPTLSGTTTVGTLTSTTGNISTSGGYISGTEVRVSGNVVINSSGVLANAFGVDVNAGVAATGFNIHGGASGHTGSTCSAWTGGICTAP